MRHCAERMFDIGEFEVKIMFEGKEGKNLVR